MPSPVRPAQVPVSGVAREVTWEALRWDDEVVQRLSAEMDHDVSPRYSDLIEERRRNPPPPDPSGLVPVPTADEVLVSWVAFVDGEPAAMASLRALGRPPKVVHEVKRVFVVPSHRRRGLADQAMEAVERSAAERGIATLRLQTGTRQPEAIALYERRGWRRIAPYPPYLTPTSVCFEKDLDR